MVENFDSSYWAWYLEEDMWLVKFSHEYKVYLIELTSAVDETML